MSLQEILNLLKQRPFEPFGIYMSDGSAYPVNHPDQIILTPRAVHVGIGGNGHAPVAQEVVVCSLLHITRLGPVPRGRNRGRKPTHK